MAKRTPKVTVAAKAEPEPLSLSAKTEKLVDAIRRPFNAFVTGFKVLETKRADLAIPFMRAAKAWMDDTDMGFVDWVRYLVPDIGDTVAEYNAHPAYNSARNLKRKAEQLARQQRKPETETEKAARVAAAPASQLTAVARLIATITSIVTPEQVDRLKQAMRAELHWPDRRVDSVMEDATEATPLVTVRCPRGVELPHLRLAFPEHTERGERAAA